MELLINSFQENNKIIKGKISISIGGIANNKDYYHRKKYNQLKENINNFKRSFKSFSPLICFAIKSNTNVNLISEIRKLGLGADVVSMGELMKALKAGIKPNKIVFSGVGKTVEEIKYAINSPKILHNT